MQHHLRRRIGPEFALELDSASKNFARTASLRFFAASCPLIRPSSRFACAKRLLIKLAGARLPQAQRLAPGSIASTSLLHARVSTAPAGKPIASISGCRGSVNAKFPLNPRCCSRTSMSASVTRLTSRGLRTVAGSAAGNCPCSQMQSRIVAGSPHRSASRLPTTM